MKRRVTSDRRTDVVGSMSVTVGRYGVRALRGEHPLSAYFEMHIEQGPVLEAEETEIGIVTGVQNVRWSR